ncbi:MAG: YtxH domain-containing protein [Bacteroidia bacterium]|jgi:gas vesicle protein
MSSGKIVVGLLAGIAAGALLGILFAPDKGSETRKKIAAQGADTAEELKSKLESLLNVLAEKFDAVQKDTAQKGHNENAV